MERQEGRKAGGQGQKASEGGRGPRMGHERAMSYRFLVESLLVLH